MSRDNSSSSYSQSPLPIHLCFLLVILFMFLTFSWYIHYESLFEALFDQIKLVLIVSPLLLLLALHLLSNFDTTWSSFLVPLPEKDSFHRAGGSPWGVALVLVLLLFLVSYQSDFRERWFPLLSR
ncbi:hypothetical protein DCAR_0728696 [Daucus carota subsp. sativus]|uniref:Uncharacterized protein n=1 Tax=Daucus carota subsp. sativus TaxID=79200 RepID=A0AAF0XJG2_DAUCS|nr:hypothetical protein DCAR_0728696 [Daucus carota subsp. sativus]